MGQAIRISRHARDRMKLYGITAADVTATISVQIPLKTRETRRR